jgi:hypothetical protein
MFLYVRTIFLKSVTLLMDISNADIKVIYTFVPLESYGLKHTCLHSAGNNSDYHYCCPAQVPIQRTIRYASNIGA